MQEWTAIGLSWKWKKPLFECKCECNFECNCRFSWFSEILSYCQKPLKNKAFPTSIVSYLSFSDASYISNTQKSPVSIRLPGQAQMRPARRRMLLPPGGLPVNLYRSIRWKESAVNTISTLCVKIGYDNGVTVSIDCISVENRIPRNMYESQIGPRPVRLPVRSTRNELLWPADAAVLPECDWRRCAE